MQENQQVGPESGGFRLSIAGTDLKFHEARIGDPVPTGRQIIEVAGGNPPDDYIVLQWLPNKDLDEIELVVRRQIGCTRHGVVGKAR